MNYFRLTILDRYLLREILQVLSAVLLVLVLVILTNKLTRFLKNAAAGEWPADIIMPMLGLTAINSLALIMPMAVFLAVILAIGRFYKDSEMAVISSCGISTYQLYRPLSLLALVLGVFIAFMSFYVIPITKRAALIIEEQAEKTSEITGVIPGRFLEASGGRRVVYVESVNDETNEVENVFIRVKQKKQLNIITAKTAYQYEEPETGDTLIFLKDGNRYVGEPGETDFRATQFDMHWIRTSGGRPNYHRIDYETRDTLDLIGSDNPFDQAELHMRIAIVLSPIIFTYLGLPMGRLRQREGRYGRIMVGVLIYIIYFKLLRMGQVLIERESIPSWLGLWWVHAGLLAYLIWTLYAESRVKSGGWWARRRLARAV